MRLDFRRKIMRSDITQQQENDEDTQEFPEYEPPSVVTYRGDELLDMLGPAQACSFNHSVVLCG